LYCAYIKDSKISASKDEINNYILDNDVQSELFESEEKLNNYVKYKVLEGKSIE